MTARLPAAVAVLASALLASAVLATGTAVLFAPSAAAAASPLPAGAPTASIRLAHLSPTTPPMDVYAAPFDGSESVLLPDIGYGAVSNYVSAAPGSYVFSWRPAGTAASRPPILTMSAVLEAGGAYTVAGIGSDDDVRSVLIGDDLTPPEQGAARVRFINADPSAGDVDLTIVGGAALVVDAKFASVTDYAAVPAGPWSLNVVTAEAPRGQQMDVNLTPGSVNTLLLLDTKSPVGDLSAVIDSPGMTLIGGSSVMSAVSDAAGAPAAPLVGGVATGMGGTAAGLGGPAAGATGTTAALAWALGTTGLGIALLLTVRASRRGVMRSLVVVAAMAFALLLTGCATGDSSPTAEMSAAAEVSAAAEMSAAAQVSAAAIGAPRPVTRDAAVPAPRVKTTDLRPSPVGAVSTTVPASSPVRVTVASVGIDSTLVELGLTADGAVAPPEDPDTAGWFTGSTQPGQVGPAVIAAHVDSSTGPAAFYRLADVAVGDEIGVARQDGSALSFQVTAIEQYPKDGFPTDAVYGPTPGAVIRLITCGGTFDRASGHYRDNVVVYAELV